MQEVLRALGLSITGIFHPRILWLSVRPFIVAALIWGIALWFIWDPILEGVRTFLTTSIFTNWIQSVMDQVGWEGTRTFISPFFAVVMLMPMIIITLLVIVSFTSVDGVVKHLVRRKVYADLKELHGGSVLGSFFYSIWSTLLCLILVVLTLPAWWVPPFFAVIPPLLWGWLTMRLMCYDVLARHASVEERAYLLKQNRWRLLGMGVVAGLLGAIPSFLWVSSIFLLVLFPVISIFMIWIYTIVFIFAALWFANYLLYALKNLRQLKGDLHE